MDKSKEKSLAGRKPDEINNSGGRLADPGAEVNSQTGKFTMGTGHLGTQGVTSDQLGTMEEHEFLTPQTGHLGTQSIGSRGDRKTATETSPKKGE